MSYGNAAVAYREREVMTASPAKLVVIVFDHLLMNLFRAKHAIEAKKIEARIDAVGKAREAVLELLAGVDVEKGGALAENLRELYVFLFSELDKVVRAPDVAHVAQLSAVVTQLREGFSTIAANPSVQSPAA